jgi:hypothetical protein
LGTKGGDFIAFLGCYNGLMGGNAGYGQINCPYDVWDGATNIRVLGNYAEGPFAQAANFNATGGLTDPGIVKTSDGYICANNEFRCTNPTLFGAINFDDHSTGDGSLSTNVVIANNIMYGCTIVGRGNVLNARIQGNTMILTGNSAVTIGALNGFTPSNVQVLGNIIPNPQSPGQDIIEVQCNGYVIDGNIVTGGNYVSAVATTTFLGIVGPTNQLAAGTSTAVRGSAWQSTLSDLQIPNNANLRFFDTASTYAYFQNRSDNVFLLEGRDASGALISGFSWQQRATGAGFTIAPTTNIGTVLANSVRVQGAASGSRPAILINPNSTDANVSMEGLGRGTGGWLSQALSITGPPIAADIPAGFFTVAPDGSGNFRLYANKGGTIVSVALS